MYDAYLASLWIFDSCIDDYVVDTISHGLRLSPGSSRRLVSFLCMVHDIGKATPGFQGKSSTNSAALESLGYKPSKSSVGYDHASSGANLLVKILADGGYDLELVQALSSVVAAHHGKPLSHDPTGRRMSPKDGVLRPEWRTLQKNLLDWCLQVTDVAPILRQSFQTPRRVLVLLSAIVMLTDWFVSDEHKYPLSGDVPLADMTNRLEHAKRTVEWEKQSHPVGSAPSAEELLHIVAPQLPAEASPNPMQHLVYAQASRMPTHGILTIEADMGLGKTEASEMAIDILSRRCGLTGIAYALPTMATTDAMFGRMKGFLAHLATEMGESTVRLAHSRYRMSQTWNDMHDDKSNLIIEPWYDRAKLAMLSDFVVCTIDQILAMSLATKHVAFKHLGLAGKIVVVDEVHSYDAYMSEFLEASLEGLGSYGVPVVLMSATLSSDARQRLMCAYAKGLSVMDADINESYARLSGQYDLSGYPRVSFFGESEEQLKYGFGTCITEKVPKDVSLRYIDSDFNLVEKIDELARAGYRVGIVRNTVRLAQETYDLIRGSGLDALISHSRFRACDRLDNDAELLRALGPQSTENGLVVVGTQTIEQSLDIDFDVMFTDIAPIDSILQRLGRLWRHSNRVRPKGCDMPVAYIMGAESWDLATPTRFTSGIDRVYAKTILWRTVLALSECNGQISIPADISPLTEKVFSLSGAVPPGWEDEVSQSDFEFRFGKKRDESEAAVATVRPISQRYGASTLSGWFSDVNLVEEYGDILSESSMPSGVRKTDISAVAILVQEVDGHLVVPSKNGDGIDLGMLGSIPLSNAIRQAIATSVSLPKMALVNGGFDYLLEQQKAFGWNNHPDLRGFTPLAVNRKMQADIPHNNKICHLQYDFEAGLRILHNY